MRGEREVPQRGRITKAASAPHPTGVAWRRARKVGSGGGAGRVTRCSDAVVHGLHVIDHAGGRRRVALVDYLRGSNLFLFVAATSMCLVGGRLARGRERVQNGRAGSDRRARRGGKRAETCGGERQGIGKKDYRVSRDAY